MIYTKDIIQAYRIKLFLSRFAIRAFVLSPDLPKNQFKSLIHFFHLGQFNILILLQTGYSVAPDIKDVANVINFDAPEQYSVYKQNGSRIDNEQGAVVSLVTAQEKEYVDTYERKMKKSYVQEQMLKCIPILWEELLKIKSRVEDVTKGLDNKKVKTEKENEFKKQLLSNKRLKEYFNQHPDEKLILQNDIKKNDVSGKNSLMFKHLSFLPSYVLPTQLLALSP